MARVAEDAGADALHLADHIVLPESSTSTYPFTADGRFPFAPDSDWYDVFASCAWAAAVTSTVQVGPSVVVLPQRNALEVAKVSSTLSRLSGGRFFLGVGAGWLREEFVALGRDFDHRAAAMLEGIDVLRLAWSGSGHGYVGEHNQVPEGTHCRPVPAPGGVPVLLGGMSNAALRRAARHGDGWIALMGAREDVGALGAKLDKVRDLRADYELSASFHAVIRVVNYGGSATESADHVRELVELGFDEVVIDPGWDDLDHAARLIALCRRSLD
jgi:probable F420-dependent oxidoreductase